mmetsp:Transcript_8582/g.27361  ORF Transcript_8582/g.27361 Transcript_8582/m.27361 type:complete len:345 (-) Transcript_8582:32-1066(-)
MTDFDDFDDLDALISDLDGISVKEQGPIVAVEMSTDELDGLIAGLESPKAPEPTKVDPPPTVVDTKTAVSASSAGASLLPSSSSSRRAKKKASPVGVVQETPTLRRARKQAENDDAAAPAAPAASSARPICAACAKDIALGEPSTRVAADRVYHTACFVCGECNKVLIGEFRVLDAAEVASGSTARCEDCYAAHFKCRKCNEVIDGKYLLSGGARYHPGCAPRDKTCAKCSKPIESKLVTALGVLWHPECLVCIKCTKPVSTAFYQDADKNPVCPECNGDAAVDASVTCAACNKPFDGEFFKIRADYFHRQCFKCTSCDAALEDAQFYDLDGKVVCIDCKRKAN